MADADSSYRQLLATGDFEQAESQLRAAIALDAGSVGPESHQVAGHLHRLATVLAAGGRLDDAIEHYERALAIKRQHLVPGDPDLTITLHDLAVLYAATGREHEAHSLWTEAREGQSVAFPITDDTA